MPDSLVKDGELVLYGTVGDNFFGDGFTSLQVIEALAELGRGADVVVRLNSGGGFADEGKAIFNALRAQRGKVTVSIDGIAASAASIIALGGDNIIMRQGALFMIHEAEVLAMGDAETLDKAQAMLEATNVTMADIYSERSGQTLTAVRKAMKAETWYDGREALDAGYCDKTEKSAKAVAAAAFPYRQLYENAPQRILALADQKGWSKAKLGKGLSMATKPRSTPKPKPDEEDEEGEGDEAVTAQPKPRARKTARRSEPDDDEGALDPQEIADRAAEISILCNAAKVPALAAILIREQIDVDAAKARIEDAKKIKASVVNMRKTFPALPESLADQLIAAGNTLAEAKSQIFERVEAIQAATPTKSPLNRDRASPPQDPNLPEGMQDEDIDKALAKAVNRVNARFRPGQAMAGAPLVAGKQ